MCFKCKGHQIGLAVKGENKRRRKTENLNFLENKEVCFEKMLIFLFAMKFQVSYGNFSNKKYLSCSKFKPERYKIFFFLLLFWHFTANPARKVLTKWQNVFENGK